VQHAVWAPLTAFAATLVTVWWLARSRFAALVLDHPNERSLHERPVPRTGGVGILAGVLLAWLFVSPHLPPVIWAGAALLAAVSLLDDARGVPVIARLAAHVIAAGAAAYVLLLPDFGAAAVLAAALAIAWMCNLYNFMDGSDGLAGGMTLIGFGAYGIAALFSGSHAFALLNFSIAAAAAAFLLFNFHPARVFMGDVGAVPLGFLAAAFGLVGWLQRDWTWWFPLLVFSAFIVDASVTLARRAWRRERVWQAHRDHYYQRLVRMGWGHRRTALAEYALMAGCGLLALAALTQPAVMQAAVLLLAAAVYALLIGAISRKWREKAGESPHGKHLN
jgi:UDP-GlcNAc:undecaprenyl-phosphate GlcNAc-1-phosphate transferase